jgi:two-component system OmpR family sensor kinase
MALVVPLSAAAAWLLVEVFAARLLRDIDVALEEEAETVAALLERSAPVTMPAILAHVAGEVDLGVGKQVVVTRNGQVLGESPSGARAILTSGNDPSLRVVTFSTGASENALTVTIGVPATAAVHARRRLAMLLGLGTPSLLLALGTGIWIVAGLALRPLEQTAQQLDRITEADLSARVHVRAANDEVGQVVSALNQMLGRLQQSVTELQRFTADAAHELRTPLAILRTGLDVVLARERSVPEYEAALREALVSTDRLCKLAEDLLTLTRMDTQPERFAPVDIAEMLAELTDAWMPICAQRGIEMRVQVSAGGALHVNGDARDLYRLFNNLIDNAVQHGGEGGRIEVSTQATPPWVQVSVADEGPGIGPGESERVFERFYRSSTARAKGTGSGLGLSIARRIVLRHGGRITVGNSRVGCIAQVTLPLGLH